MNIIDAIILGVVQGVAEFLPISSSGHLRVYEILKGYNLENNFFDVMVHVGTFFAIVIFFRKRIWNIIKALGDIVKKAFTRKLSAEQFKENESYRLIFIIFIASIPTGILGVLIKYYATWSLASLVFIGVMFSLTGIYLLIPSKPKQDVVNYKEVGLWQSVLIGFAQGFAVFPGLSRSGLTIKTARNLGIKSTIAGELSFLLFLPAVAAAAILTVKDIAEAPSTMMIVTGLVGLVVAFIVSYFSLKLLMFIIRKGKLFYFSFYLIPLGIVVILLAIFRS